MFILLINVAEELIVNHNNRILHLVVVRITMNHFFSGYHSVRSFPRSERISVIGVYVQQVAIYIYKISSKVYFGSSAFCDLNLNF